MYKIILFFSFFCLFSNNFKEVKRVLTNYCFSCHNDTSKLVNGGNLSIGSLASILEGGWSGSAVKKHNANDSLLYQRVILSDTNPLAMPPRNRYASLTDKDKNILADWINSGAEWPKNIKLELDQRNKDAVNPREFELVKRIREKILLKNKNKAFKNYTDTLKYDSLEMVAIPAGEVRLKEEENDKEVIVDLDAFWVSKYEIPWELFLAFMESEKTRNRDGSLFQPSDKESDYNLIARPTPPYHAMNFGMPIRKHPGLAMTQHSANKFAQWLSYITGNFYRLPTEAEWEYVAKAKTNNIYPWGNDRDAADKYAWYSDNSDESYHRLGKKLPNAFGVYDLAGNVQEWTLDQYVENRYKYVMDKYNTNRVKNLWIKATKPYPHTTKGGHWDSSLDLLKISSRLPSNPNWKISDPQIPKSLWYLTDVQWIGLRLVRPIKVPSTQDMYDYWNSGVEYDE